jgi:surface antigen
VPLIALFFLVPHPADASTGNPGAVRLAPDLTLSAVEAFQPVAPIAASISAAEAPTPKKVIPAQKDSIAIRWGGQFKPGKTFPWGQCTWYVSKERKGLGFRGNAGEMYTNAKRAGYKVGKIPTPGAIAVTRESSVGHVSIVRSYDAKTGTFIVEEANFKGFGIVSKRKISLKNPLLVGFIY